MDLSSLLNPDNGTSKSQHEQVDTQQYIAQAVIYDEAQKRNQRSGSNHRFTPYDTSQARHAQSKAESPEKFSDYTQGTKSLADKDPRDRGSLKDGSSLPAGTTFGRGPQKHTHMAQQQSQHAQTQTTLKGKSLSNIQDGSHDSDHEPNQPSVEGSHTSQSHGEQEASKDKEYRWTRGMDDFILQGGHMVRDRKKRYSWRNLERDFWKEFSIGPIWSKLKKRHYAIL